MSTPFDPLASATTTSQENFYSPDYLALRRAWINEQRAPELLQYETSAVENIMKSLRPQWNLISARQAQWTGRDSHLRDLLIMEADRVSYILKSYLRARLFKIQKFARHYLLQGGQSLMSPAEIQFATNILGVSENAYKSMFLNFLPKGDEYFQSLVASDDPAGDLVRRPDIEKIVLAKVHETIGTVSTGVTADDTVTIEKDKVYMIRYDLIRDFIRDSRISLI